MKEIKTILLFGGTSEERRVSVATAQNVASALENAEFWFMSPEGRMYFVAKAELMSHKNPFTEDFIPKGSQRAQDFELAVSKLSNPFPVVCFGLHGGEGENGKLQGILEKRKIPFTGSGSKASSRAFDKAVSRKTALSSGVTIADGVDFLTSDSELLDLLQERLTKFGPQVLKPIDGGSSIGVFFLNQPGELEEIAISLKNMGTRKYLAETTIIGKELTVGVLEEGTKVFALPASEVRVEKNRNFDYEGKYLGKGTREITPAEISQIELVAAQELAVKMHKALGCYGYSRTDMILAAKGPYYLETNTLPGLTKASFIPQQLEVAKIPFKKFIEEQIELALKRYD